MCEALVTEIRADVRIMQDVVTIVVKHMRTGNKRHIGMNEMLQRILSSLYTYTCYSTDIR